VAKVCEKVAHAGSLRGQSGQEKTDVLGPHTCNAVASSGNLEALKWAIENGCPWQSERLCDIIIRGGRLEALKYIRTKGAQLDESTCSLAAFVDKLKF
jgi:hypothetical protein